MFCCNPFKGRRRREEWGDAWRVKVVVVGDSQCGKTSLIQRYCCGTLPHTYTPTLFDAHTTSCLVEDRKVQMIIQDTAGQEDLDRLRPPFYLHSDVIIVCFDVDNPDSWDKVRKVWVPESRHNCGKHVPILIVATKGDQASPKTSAQVLHPDRPDSNTTTSQNDDRGTRDSGSRDSSLFGSTEDLGRVDDEKRSLLAESRFRAGKTNPTFGSRRTTHRDRHNQGGPALKALDEGLLRPAFSNRRTPPAPPAPEGGSQHLGSTEQRGNKLAAQVGAVRYLETSAVLNQGVQRVFSTALTAAMASKQWRKKYRL